MKEINKTLNKIKQPDILKEKAAQRRLDILTKPKDSLGLLENIARRIVGITGKELPQISNKVIFTMAGDHGVTEEGVSAFPKEVTVQMVNNFINEGAAINVLAGHIGAKVIIVDMGVDGNFDRKDLVDLKINYGTKNMTKESAMTKKEAIKSIEAGIHVFKQEIISGIDIVGIGEMGIGNTTSSSAIVAALMERNIEEVVDRGTGINDKLLKNKISSIKKAIELNKPDRSDPIDVLSKLGGFEIGGMAGIIIAAASEMIPVVLDGFISGAAALIAYSLEPKVKDYIFASHCSVEKGHRVTLDYMGLKPLFDLELRLGEGTGAAIGINIIEAAVKIFSCMATFEEASVSKKD
ncbi:MAG: nicotinate-nucleotide--dimethylbenzimidazole phosphoribosyltransferase [Actinomycetia bacterium]|nr:nicotinate-nucleotide--dimethylbenzimidazole phosphoribosyltransferase [Actinomycetes bacterium]